MGSINDLKDKVLSIAFLTIFLIFLKLIFNSFPPSEIIIEAGPKGGFFDYSAGLIAQKLEQYGIQATIHNREDTLKIIDDIEVGKKAGIGFIAQDLGAMKYNHVEVVGTALIEPAFIHVRKAANIDIPADLVGKRIASQPLGSGSQIFCDRLYGLYGINRSNAHFQEMGFKEAVEALETEHVDAICVLQPITNQLIQRIGKNPRLHPLELIDNAAVLGFMPFTNTVKIPKSAFSFYPSLPEKETNLVGLPVSVIAHRNLHPSIIRLVSLALFEEFSQATAISEAYEFPDFKEPKLFASSVARNVYKNPRNLLYTTLNFKFAATLDKFLTEYGYAGGIFFFMMAFYSFMGFPKPYPYWLKRRAIALQEKIAEFEHIKIQNGSLTADDEREVAKLKNALDRSDIIKYL